MLLCVVHVCFFFVCVFFFFSLVFYFFWVSAGRGRGHNIGRWMRSNRHIYDEQQRLARQQQEQDTTDDSTSGDDVVEFPRVVLNRVEQDVQEQVEPQQAVNEQAVQEQVERAAPEQVVPEQAVRVQVVPIQIEQQEPVNEPRPNSPNHRYDFYPPIYNRLDDFYGEHNRAHLQIGHHRNQAPPVPRSYDPMLRERQRMNQMIDIHMGKTF